MHPPQRLLGMLSCAGTLCLASHARAAPPLSAYNAEPGESSVSGLSSGGYMAVQLSVAYSQLFRGAGIIAGGPYHCAAGSVSSALGSCMNGLPAPSAVDSIAITDARAAAGLIDPTTHLGAQRIWLFSGLLDTTVRPVVMDRLHAYYAHYLPAANLRYVNDVAAAHTLPTDAYGNLCQVSAKPYLSSCDYDAAGELLAHIYGPLEARAGAETQPTGQLLEFDQTELVPATGAFGASMADSGFVFVPMACARGEPCRVHVALHGCKQARELVDDTFARHAGYNAWADTNRLLVLYPQAVSSDANPQNPNGCWDWWGYNDASSYDTRDGVQVKALKNMVDRLTSGFGQPPDLPSMPDGSASLDAAIELPYDAGAISAGDAGNGAGPPVGRGQPVSREAGCALGVRGRAHENATNITMIAVVLCAVWRRRRAS